MSRIVYLYSKVKSAWRNGALWDKSIRFLITMFRRPFEVVTGYVFLSNSDRSLNAKDGFADHRKKGAHHRSNPEHIRRIIAAYKAAKQDQGKVAPPYQIKGLWAEWIAVNYQKLISALEAEDVPALSSLMENLFREQFTIGTGGYDDYIRYHTLLGSFYVKYLWSDYRDKLVSLDHDIQKVAFPAVGNPSGVFLNGNILPIETLRHAYHAVEMNQLLRNVPKANIVEIGAGFGGQAWQAMQIAGDRVSKYVIFDIPEVAAISSYFLLSALPEKKIRLFGEGNVSVDISESFDLAIFPHFAIAQLPDSSVDLFYNSCSFSEMDGASAREYLSVVERSCRRYFLHDNHDTVLKFINPDGSTSLNVIGSKLLPDAKLFKRVFKKPRVHNRPEDRPFVQFEYLYERIA